MTLHKMVSFIKNVYIFKRHNSSLVNMCFGTVFKFTLRPKRNEYEYNLPKQT